MKHENNACVSIIRTIYQTDSTMFYLTAVNVRRRKVVRSARVTVSRTILLLSSGIHGEHCCSPASSRLAVCPQRVADLQMWGTFRTADWQALTNSFFNWLVQFMFLNPKPQKAMNVCNTAKYKIWYLRNHVRNISDAPFCLETKKVWTQALKY